jgi:hypothetical protein
MNIELLKTISICVHTGDEKLAALELLSSLLSRPIGEVAKKYAIQAGSSRNYMGGRYVRYDGTTIEGGVSSNGKRIVDFVDIPALLIELNTPLPIPVPIEVPLNGDYIAIVSKDEITVGCQKFPLDIIDKLVAARDEILAK